MKNSNERIPFFDNLPTADEAERMEAAVSEADHGEYNETAVTNLALAGMQAERNQAADHTEKPRIFRKNRRTVLLAACLAVVVLTTLCAAAKLIYDARFPKLLGLGWTTPGFDKGYYKIGITKSYTEMTATVVDAFGDAHEQWIEVKTDRKLKKGTPDGFLYLTGLSADERLSCATWDFDVHYAEGLHLSDSFTELDFIDFYRYEERRGFSYNSSGVRICPFCRDGFLWYLVNIVSRPTVSLNHGIVRLDITIPDEQGNSWPFAFTWNCDYDSKEKTVTVNRKLKDVTITDITLSATEIYINYLGLRENSRLISITLADGTVLNALDCDHIPDDFNISVHRDYDPSLPDWDGFIHYMQYGAMGGYKRYSLLPNASFQTDSEHSTLIPVDDIVSININGVEISLR